MKATTVPTELLDEGGAVMLGNGVQARLWPEGRSCPLFQFDGLEVGLEDSWFRGYEIPPPPEPVYVRLLRRLFGGGPIHQATGAAEICFCSARVGFQVICVLQRYVVGRWVLHGSCCPQCGCIYLKNLQEFQLTDVPLVGGPLG